MQTRSKHFRQALVMLELLVLFGALVVISQNATPAKSADAAEIRYSIHVDHQGVFLRNFIWIFNHDVRLLDVPANMHCRIEARLSDGVMLPLDTYHPTEVLEFSTRYVDTGQRSSERVSITFNEVQITFENTHCEYPEMDYFAGDGG